MAKYALPIIKKVFAIPTDEINLTIRGPLISAAVASTRLFGNHFTREATGVI